MLTYFCFFVTIYFFIIKTFCFTLINNFFHYSLFFLSSLFIIYYIATFLYNGGDFDSYLDLIRNNDTASFSRHSKVSVEQLFLQMMDRKGQSQWGDIIEFYKDINKKADITEKGFYLARSKFNPEAIRVMGNDFIANVYDNYDDSMKKYKDCFLLAVDGSKVILPTTKEIFGFEKIKDNNNPAMGSFLHCMTV